MKRILSLFLAVVMVFSLNACKETLKEPTKELPENRAIYEPEKTKPEENKEEIAEKHELKNYTVEFKDCTVSFDFPDDIKNNDMLDGISAVKELSNTSQAVEITYSILPNNPAKTIEDYIKEQKITNENYVSCTGENITVDGIEGFRYDYDTGYGKAYGYMLFTDKKQFSIYSIGYTKEPDKIENLRIKYK